jgi:hypothetical protein
MPHKWHIGDDVISDAYAAVNHRMTTWSPLHTNRDASGHPLGTTTPW